MNPRIQHDSSELLDATDQELFQLLSREPLLSQVAIGRRLGISDRTVARRLETMQRRGLISFGVRTSIRTSGDRFCLVTMSVLPSKAEEIAKSLAGAATTGWIRLNLSRTRLTLALLTRGAEADPVLATLANDPRVKGLESFEILREWWADPSLQPLPPQRELDELDRQIVDGMRHNARIDSTTLSKSLGVDASTVSRRRKRLLDEGLVTVQTIRPATEAGSATVSTAMVWLEVRPGSWGRVARQLLEREGVHAVFGLSEFGGLSALVTCPHAELVDFIDESCSDEAILRARVDALGKAYKDHPTVGLSPRGGAAEGQPR